MLTSRHSLYKLIRSHVVHATSISGLRGILLDRCIRPNPDGRLAHNSLGGPDCYACQKLNAVSVLDLGPANEQRLFDRTNPFQNWAGVFGYHNPTVLLVLNQEKIRYRLVSGEQVTQLGGRYIAEAECCHPGDIPIELIIEGLLIGSRYRLIRRSNDLKSLLVSASEFRRRSDRRTLPIHIFHHGSTSNISRHPTPVDHPASSQLGELGLAAL